MSYLISRYKGKYRLLAPYDLKTNQFPRETDESLIDNDVYIDCQRGIKVFYWGRGILQAYTPSIGIGRNILKQIYAEYINPKNVNIEQIQMNTGLGEINKTKYNITDAILYENELKKLTNKDIIFNIEETDEEVLFMLKAENDEKIFPLLKPKTSGANRSPFSSKNLPKASYNIPENDLVIYKELTKNFSIENGDWLKITRLTKEFIDSLATKKNTIENIKLDMAKKCLKGKEYIHSISKWNEYIQYLKKGLKNED